MDWNLALEMAILSLAAYDDGEVFREWYDEVEYFEHKPSDTEAYAMSAKGTIVIVIRGSDTVLDWLWNIRKLGRTKEDDLYVAIDQSVKGLIGEGILDFIGDHDGEVHLTGHSKGGVIAEILATEFLGVHGVWGFGSPRPGGRRWAKRYPLKNTAYSFSTNFDFITHLPPVFLGFRRAVPRVKIGGCGHDMDKYVDLVNQKCMAGA